ncbi:MAG: HAMP domain-containing histidine kinase [Pyrinomonadaceae bacterium]|nr:HAMP domain-containing histidine kinase [Pyrinomonadaceae bacterium]
MISAFLIGIRLKRTKATLPILSSDGFAVRNNVQAETHASLLRYGVAVLSVALATVIRLLLEPVLGGESPLLLFTLSVMISAWYGRLWPGLLATLLGASIGTYLFFAPYYSLRLINPNDRVSLFLFVLVGALISLLCEALHSSRKRAEKIQEEIERLLAREQAARAEAETANRLKDEFLATVSHELRTPLTLMLMWTRMLASGKLDEETSAYALKTLAGSVKTFAQLINDLLDVSRSMMGKLRINPRSIELEPVIAAAIETVQPAADAKNIKLVATPDAPVYRVWGDPDRLQQVIWNILSNAIKFTPAGGRVELMSEHDGTTARIIVCDTGQGIDAECLPRIFERFYQADESSGGRGLGLGLAIVRHLTEMHGGSVRAASPGRGQGATFTVELPLLELRMSDSGLQIEAAANGTLNQSTAGELLNEKVVSKK